MRYNNFVTDETDTLRIFEEARLADPIVTDLAFWDQNMSSRGNPTIWQVPERAVRDLGHAMAFFTGVLSAGHLYALDQDAPADLLISVKAPPEGEAPIEVRRALTGLVMLGRTALQKEAELVRVYPPDFLMAMLQRGLVPEATWYRQYMNAQLLKGHTVETWNFKSDEVKSRKITDPCDPSWRRYTENYNLGLSPSFEPELAQILPLFLDPQDRMYKMNKEEAEALRAKLQNWADKKFHGNLAYAIQGYTKGRLTKLFKRAAENCIAEYRDDSTAGVATGWDTETGEITYGSLHGVVVFDREKGIDRRDDEEKYSGLFTKPRTQDQLAAERRLARVPVPELTELDPALRRWHTARSWHGL